ncbi:MAG: hypothetical protein AB1529_03410 [Candidatus Micrarchaeota archaeon]
MNVSKVIADKIRRPEHMFSVSLNGDDYFYIRSEPCAIYFIPAAAAQELLRKRKGGALPESAEMVESASLFFVKEGEEHMPPRYKMLVGQSLVSVKLVKATDKRLYAPPGSEVFAWEEDFEFIFEMDEPSDVQRFGVVDLKRGRSYIYEYRREKLEGEPPLRFFRNDKEIEINAIEFHLG